jgi:hypothetical protein
MYLALPSTRFIPVVNSWGEPPHDSNRDPVLVFGGCLSFKQPLHE